MSDAGAPVTIQELRMRMRQLHEKCGAPTAAAMRKAIKDFSAPRLAPASLSEFFSDKRPNALPKQDFLRGFVAACLLYRGDSPETVTEQLHTWDAWWASLVLASGTPPITITPRAPVTTPDDPNNEPRRRRPLPIIAGVVAGFALGFGSAVIIPTLFRGHATPQPRVQMVVPRPPYRSSPSNPCPPQWATLRTDRGDPAGSIVYLECADRLEVFIMDNPTDTYCISSAINWSNGQLDTTPRTCSGGVTHHAIPRQAPDFTLQLVAEP